MLGEDDLLNFWEFRIRSLDVFSTDWSWHPIISRDGPFSGPDPIQWNVHACIGLHLDAGRHTLHLVFDEPVAIDWFYASLERTFNPNETPPDARSVDLRGQLPLRWSDVKRRYASWGLER